jgi:hypothetical protein
MLRASLLLQTKTAINLIKEFRLPRLEHNAAADIYVKPGSDSMSNQQRHKKLSKKLGKFKESLIVEYDYEYSSWKLIKLEWRKRTPASKTEETQTDHLVQEPDLHKEACEPESKVVSCHLDAESPAVGEHQR